MTEAGPNAGMWAKGSINAKRGDWQGQIIPSPGRQHRVKAGFCPSQKLWTSYVLGWNQVSVCELTWAVHGQVRNSGKPGSSWKEGEETKVPREDCLASMRLNASSVTLFIKLTEFFFFKKIFIDVTELGLGCSMRDLHCGAWAWFPLSPWNLSSPTTSLALQGGFITIGPAGKSLAKFFFFF